MGVEYPLHVYFDDGDRWTLTTPEEVGQNLEWFDTEDDDSVAVVDANGRPVSLRVEALQIARLSLKDVGQDAPEAGSIDFAVVKIRGVKLVLSGVHVLFSSSGPTVGPVVSVQVSGAEPPLEDGFIVWRPEQAGHTTRVQVTGWDTFFFDRDILAEPYLSGRADVTATTIAA